jgi:P-type conjugative transfer ATPase TrbB
MLNSPPSSLRSDLVVATQPLQPYLDDPRVQEIRLNPDGHLWVSRAGEGKSRTDTTLGAGEAEDFLRLVAAESRKKLNSENASVAGTLPHWDARVQGLLPPLVLRPTFTIRKRALEIFSLQDYVDKRVITPAERDALVQAVLDRQNILVGGGTFTGKTTFTNALLRVIAEQTDHRVYIAEDNRELQFAGNDVVFVLTDPDLKYDMQRAILDALRQSPDRIIIGELRDGTALDFMKGANTGHQGSVATLHANSTAGMLTRFCELIEERIYPAPRERVAEAINVCVHLTLDSKAPSGRRLSGLDTVRGYDAERKSWVLEPLVR